MTENKPRYLSRLRTVATSDIPVRPAIVAAWVRPFLYLASLILVIWFVLVLVGNDPTELDNPAGLLTYSLIFGLASLLSLWAGLSNLSWAIRVFGFLIGSGIISAGTILITKKSDILIIAGIQAVLLVGSLMLARWWGLRLQRLGRDLSSHDEVARAAMGQFSIRDLLLWTVGFAIVFAVVQHTRFEVDSIRRRYVDLIAIVAGFVLVALFALWSVLGTAPVRMQTVTWLLAMVVISVLVDKIFHQGVRPRLYGLIWLNGAFVASALLILRALGYRLDRTSRYSPD